MKRFSSAFVTVLMLASMLTFGPVASAQQQGCRTFSQTSHTVCGRFLQYWSDHGGVAQQGYPISEAIGEVSGVNGKSYTVQYFERSVFEYHPENQPPYDVLLSLLGSARYNQKYAGKPPAQNPNTSAGFVTFMQTGKHIGGGFLTYWKQNGGVAQQGYPISDEFTEISDLDGKQYTVQYFERAVFEYHPENPTNSRTLLSQLGTFSYKARYAAGGAPVQAPPYPVPAAIAAPAPAPPAPSAPPPARVPAPTTAPVPAPSGKYTASASVSNNAPTMNQHVAVTGRLLRGGQPVAGATMNTSWHYKTTVSSCSSATDSSGEAACARSISHATPGYTVVIDVVFTTSDGQHVSTQTSFTPR